jgi:hypothetical protein
VGACCPRSCSVRRAIRGKCGVSGLRIVRSAVLLVTKADEIVKARLTAQRPRLHIARQTLNSSRRSRAKSAPVRVRIVRFQAVSSGPTAHRPSSARRPGSRPTMRKTAQQSQRSAHVTKSRLLPRTVFKTACGVLRSPAVSSGLAQRRAVHRSGWNLALAQGLRLGAWVAGVWSSRCDRAVLAGFSRHAAPLMSRRIMKSASCRARPWSKTVRLDGVNKDRIGDLLLAKTPLTPRIPRPNPPVCSDFGTGASGGDPCGCPRIISDSHGFRHFWR